MWHLEKNLWHPVCSVQTSLDSCLSEINRRSAKTFKASVDDLLGEKK